ncbi:hypothetical protein CERZMDRAFT_36862 [Cercospora zeae-maydis SCOH1-5]|uniref:Uncharacterized protein n=1 Tax=Cercospora zeae-maydis SCOH1-5 TaxID=717836 RepID=A0A6A6FNL1_9PEZI|nr:hypothetical protein CERZMDRAFT_36862 [Cercospora zeae-maydis SCOH1-5]
MVADSTPPTHERPLPANKLVKRPVSVSSTPGSPNSRIPIFRRPATSHQRSATLQGRLSGSGWDSPIPRAASSPLGNASHWRSYFSPAATHEHLAFTKRRSSTGIPNPVRRVFPDRKYTPTLVSAKEPVRVAVVEAHVSASDFEAFPATTEIKVAQRTASSPFLSYVPHVEESASPRRSFSIGDLLSTGPQPLGQRPSTSNGRPWSARSNRRLRPASMGGLVSRNIEPEFERPAKRRDLTEPTSSQRSINSSFSSDHPSSSDPAYEVDLQLGGELLRASYAENGPSAAPNPGAQIPEHHQSSPDNEFVHAARQPRTSATYSEIASTIGSESERRSLGENSTDYQSDVYYDSIPTRTTRSSSGRRGPPIETIFDDSPPTFSSGRSTKLRDFLSDGHEHNGRYSTIEEEGSVVSTPVRSLRNKSVTSTPSARPGATHIFSSSPPTMRLMPDTDDIDWDADNDTGPESGFGIQRHDSMPSFGAQTSTPTLPFRFDPALRFISSRSASATPYRNGYSAMDKPNLFDWSEPQPSPSHPQQSPPRPRTVHGKKDQDSRGSRPAGRRPVSGMHARSHSVPVGPDFDNKRSNVVANKFGTWGVGSKGVTEDWNDDFDFDELPEPVQDTAENDSRRIDSGHVMFVPKSIREQQENVVANISLLREWGLLIEELKELRVRAVALDMLTGTYAQSWREVDAMIELADQESEEHTLEPRRTPPSSPGFDASAFEDTTSIKTHVKAIPPQPPSAEVSPTRGQQQGAPAVTRPRKDSELVAQKVIAALQARKAAEDSSALFVTYPANKKVPFDTATLRHIVPYVSSLKRKVKDALRETEGLYTSPNRRRSPDDHGGADNMSYEAPALRSMLSSPQDDDVTNRRLSRRKQATTDHDGSGSPLMSHGAGLDEMMQVMSLPS